MGAGCFGWPCGACLPAAPRQPGWVGGSVQAPLQCSEQQQQCVVLAASSTAFHTAGACTPVVSCRVCLMLLRQRGGFGACKMCAQSGRRAWHAAGEEQAMPAGALAFPFCLRALRRAAGRREPAKRTCDPPVSAHQPWPPLLVTGCVMQVGGSGSAIRRGCPGLPCVPCCERHAVRRGDPKTRRRQRLPWPSSYQDCLIS